MLAMRESAATTHTKGEVVSRVTGLSSFRRSNFGFIADSVTMPEDSDRKLCASGVPLDTERAAIRPEAPGLASTTTGCPSCDWSEGPSWRASVSGVPPAG